MSPDSSSSEVDPRPQPTANCGPIQMIQVPECTQSHGGLKLQQQQQQQQHIIHADYSKKLNSNTNSDSNNGFTTKINHQQQQPIFHQKPASIVQHKSDEELNLGTHFFVHFSNFVASQCQGGR